MECESQECGECSVEGVVCVVGESLEGVFGGFVVQPVFSGKEDDVVDAGLLGEDTLDGGPFTSAAGDQHDVGWGLFHKLGEFISEAGVPLVYDLDHGCGGDDVFIVLVFGLDSDFLVVVFVSLPVVFCQLYAELDFGFFHDGEGEHAMELFEGFHDGLCGVVCAFAQYVDFL